MIHIFVLYKLSYYLFLKQNNVSWQTGFEMGMFFFLLLICFTCHFKVIYRSGVSEKCPEGDKWIEIPSPQVSITQLSVSPSGVVWGVTWEGVAVVRVGVSYYEPTGEEGIYLTFSFLFLWCCFKCNSELNNFYYWQSSCDIIFQN